MIKHYVLYMPEEINVKITILCKKLEDTSNRGIVSEQNFSGQIQCPLSPDNLIPSSVRAEEQKKLLRLGSETVCCEADTWLPQPLS